MKAGTCRHFTGLMNKRCEAGILYESVRDSSTRPYRFPCFARSESAACSKFDAVTAEEEAEFRRKVDESFARMAKVRAAIVKVTGGKRGLHGAVTCPACRSGVVGYEVHSNGHIHAACSTKDCARWME